MRTILFISATAAVSLSYACSSGISQPCALQDANCDGVPDHLGSAVLDAQGNWVEVDLNGDGVGDGPAVDTNGDGKADAALLDTDGDGLGDALDFNGDRVADQNPADSGTGGGTASGTGGGATATGGSGTGGSTSGTGGGTTVSGPGCLGGTVTQTGSGSTVQQYHTADVQRNGMNYMVMTNGWGAGFESQTLRWEGTSFTVEELQGTTIDYVPASFPNVVCGAYSETSQPCGLPASLSSLPTLETGFRWSGPSSGMYNATYDVWMGTESSHNGFFMVWYRDPPGQQPAGSIVEAGVEVSGVPGQWNVWTGSVDGKPIVNYVKAEGQDINELAFDLKDFFNHADSKGYNYGGSVVRAVAVGFEIWEGPISNIAVEDFCLEIP